MRVMIIEQRKSDRPNNVRRALPAIHRTAAHLEVRFSAMGDLRYGCAHTALASYLACAFTTLCSGALSLRHFFHALSQRRGPHALHFHSAVAISALSRRFSAFVFSHPLCAAALRRSRSLSLHSALLRVAQSQRFPQLSQRSLIGTLLPLSQRTSDALTAVFAQQTSAALTAEVCRSHSGSLITVPLSQRSFNYCTALTAGFCYHSAVTLNALTAFQNMCKKGDNELPARPCQTRDWGFGV